MADEQDVGGLVPFTEDGGRLVRRQWHEDRWYFSVVAVVGLLTEAAAARTYWAQLKAKLTTEGADETLQALKQLKMRALDGKMRATDAADVETMLRIVQSIPSPKAEPVKQWLAGVGAERLQEAADLSSLSEDQRRLYARDQLAEHNKALAAAAADSGC